MTATNFEKVGEFHKAFGIKPAHITDPEAISQRFSLLQEEVKELTKEFFELSKTLPYRLVLKGRINKKNVAKELADVLYVTYGMAQRFDIPLDDVFALVHASNMTKLGDDGKPVYRDSDGKVLKGPNYQPPNLDFLDGNGTEMSKDTKDLE